MILTWLRDSILWNHWGRSMTLGGSIARWGLTLGRIRGVTICLYIVNKLHPHAVLSCNNAY